jgi:hypothetical protein
VRPDTQRLFSNSLCAAAMQYGPETPGDARGSGAGAGLQAALNCSVVGRRLEHE